MRSSSFITASKIGLSKLIKATATNLIVLNHLIAEIEAVVPWKTLCPVSIRFIGFDSIGFF